MTRLSNGSSTAMPTPSANAATVIDSSTAVLRTG